MQIYNAAKLINERLLFRNLVPSRNKRDEWDPSVYETKNTEVSPSKVPLEIAIKLKKKEIKKFVKDVTITDQPCSKDDRFHEWLAYLDDGRLFSLGQFFLF